MELRQSTSNRISPRFCEIDYRKTHINPSQGINRNNMYKSVENYQRYKIADNNQNPYFQNNHANKFGIDRYSKIGPKSVCRLLESEKNTQYGLQSEDDAPDSVHTSSQSDNEDCELNYITPNKDLKRFSIQKRCNNDASMKSHAFSEIKQNLKLAEIITSRSKYRSSLKSGSSGSKIDNISLRNTNFGDLNYNIFFSESEIEKKDSKSSFCMITESNLNDCLKQIHTKLEEMLMRLAGSPTKYSMKGCDEQYIVQMQEICKELRLIKEPETNGRVSIDYCMNKSSELDPKSIKSAVSELIQINKKISALSKNFEGSSLVAIYLRKLTKIARIKITQVHKLSSQNFAKNSLKYLNILNKKIKSIDFSDQEIEVLKSSINNKITKECPENLKICDIRPDNTQKSLNILKANNTNGTFANPEELIKEFNCLFLNYTHNFMGLAFGKYNSILKMLVLDIKQYFNK